MELEKKRKRRKERKKNIIIKGIKVKTGGKKEFKKSRRDREDDRGTIKI